MDDLGRLQAQLGDRYQIQREIGHGGMATVYLAEDRRHHRRVAVKVLHPDLASLVGGERFLREIEIEAHLQHPNILPLHDSGETDGVLYYVMPYVEGESLRDRLEREAELALEDALRITTEIADALGYAHGHGVIHRDVKPENILLSEGHAVLADFGIARAVSEAGGERVTETGHTVGTPQYMSPEQASGEAELDGRSDIYALGCVLFEMLAGEPPFTGRTARAVMAKHMAERPPSLEVVRPGVPPGVARAIERALAKTPADRFRTTQEFVAALREGAERGAKEQEAGQRRRWMIATAAAAIVAVAALVVWRVVWPPSALADPNKIVVFPLVDTRDAETGAGEGWEVAIAIGAAFEHTQPLKWIDGWRQLPEPLRQDPRRLTPGLSAEISRERGARYYLDGVISRMGEALSVALQLHDAQGDSLVARETSMAQASQASNVPLLGLDAIRRLLPRLVDPDREIDLSALTGQHPGAVALWVQGEREYRQARIVPALELYKRAVALDSTFAFAALKGAQAANWRSEHDEARALIELAIAHDSILPPKYVYLAHGVHDYLTGRADSAAANLKRAVATDPDWAEAATALAETYQHLFPSEFFLDTLAAYWFNRALAMDSTFLIPLVHLAERAIRRGDVRLAEELTDRLAAVDPDVHALEELELALGCVGSDPSCFAWDDNASAESLWTLLLAAKTLSEVGVQQAFALQGFLSVLHSQNAPVAYKWGALEGAQGLLVASGRYEEARALIDSAIVTQPPYMILHVFDANLGLIADSELFEVMKTDAEEAVQFARDVAGERYETARSFSLWLLGVWHARQGDVDLAEALLLALQARADSSGSREERLLAEALAPHVILARGDTALAIQHLRALKPTAHRSDLEWEIAEPLALERLLLAELLLARGEFREAHDVATVFDHPQSIILLPCLRASLMVRLRAAEALSDPLARSYRQRLRALGLDL